MNIRKGMFRLTLILSILVGIISSFPLLEHAIKNPDGIVRRSLPYFFQLRIDNELENRTMESYGKKIIDPWERDREGTRGVDFLRKLHSKTHYPFGPDYILYWWRHLAVLSIPGFVAVWFIYGLSGWVIIPFIVRGFQGSSARGG